MQTDQQIIYSEKQKLDIKKWILIPLGIAIIVVVVLLAIPFLYFCFTEGTTFIQETFRPANYVKILVVCLGGIFPLILIYFVRRRMTLELNITKFGLQYDYTVLTKKTNTIPWEQVVSIELKKYLYARRPGKQIQFSNSRTESFVMNVDGSGIELTLLNGQKRFFTSNETDELIKAIKKLGLNIQFK